MALTLPWKMIQIRLVSVVLDGSGNGQFSYDRSCRRYLPTSDAVYFVEKVAFLSRILLKFKNRTELSDYLMLKYDNSWDKDTAHTFIMENSDLMDGWRILDEQKTQAKSRQHRIRWGRKIFTSFASDTKDAATSYPEAVESVFILEYFCSKGTLGL